MSRAARYLLANAVLVVCLAAAWDSENSLWVTVIGGLAAAVVVNLLVAFVDTKGDPRRV